VAITLQFLELLPRREEKLRFDMGAVWRNLSSDI
jgi:hypothetical protein